MMLLNVVLPFNRIDDSVNLGVNVLESIFGGEQQTVLKFTSINRK